MDPACNSTFGVVTTQLTKAYKQELWSLLDDDTRAELKELSRKYQGALRQH